MRGLERDRQHMVRHQLVQQGIKDERVLRAMARVPRHLYLSPERWDEAYAPRAVPIGNGQTISQPYMVALMSELLQLRGGEHVLEIGTGSGYQTAVLAELAADVVTVERIERLAEAARALLQDEGVENVEVVVGDGTRGWAARAPYDRILVTAAAPQIPSSLLEQLGDPGILVCPVGDRQMQMLHILHRSGGMDRVDRRCACRFVPLLGEEGFAGEA